MWQKLLINLAMSLLTKVGAAIVSWVRRLASAAKYKRKGKDAMDKNDPAAIDDFLNDSM